MHLYLLSALAHIGKSALCPVICPMDEQWLEPETDRIAFLEERLLRIYNSLSLSQYRQLRDQPHSLYLGIVWPGAYLINKDDPSRHHKISGAICLAACVIKEFDLFSWFAGLQCWGPDEVGGAILPINRKHDITRYLAVFRITGSVLFATGYYVVILNLARRSARLIHPIDVSPFFPKTTNPVNRMLDPKNHCPGYLSHAVSHTI